MPLIVIPFTKRKTKPPKRFGIVEMYASYIFKKPPLLLSKTEIEIARRELFEVIVKAYVESETVEEARERVLLVLKEFFNEYPTVGKSWRVFKRVMNSCSEEEIESLPNDVKEELKRLVIKNGNKLPRDFRRKVEKVLGVSYHPKKRRGEKRNYPLWAYYAMAVEDKPLSEIPYTKKKWYESEFKKKVAKCWFTKTTLKGRMDCLKRELSIMFEKFPNRKFHYNSFLNVVREITPFEIAEAVPPDKILLFLRRGRVNDDLRKKLKEALRIGERFFMRFAT